MQANRRLQGCPASATGALHGSQVIHDGTGVAVGDAVRINVRMRVLTEACMQLDSSNNATH